jgi:succinylarginine dihydrolase
MKGCAKASLVCASVPLPVSAANPDTSGSEFNFDGLVGPTHNFSGASIDNKNSTAAADSLANPKKAALEGLEKMRYLSERGILQAVLPPQERPLVDKLRQLGICGSDAHVIERAARSAPELLRLCASASSMWAANAATVSPSADTSDGKVHFTPANLASQFHRSLEARLTSRILKRIFSSEAHFAHHEPLPSHGLFGDEGAANHMRVGKDYGAPGTEVFVFGRSIAGKDSKRLKFLPRQTQAAAEAVVRLHKLASSRTLLLQQSPTAINAGAFHNDLVAMSNQNVMIYHESAFLPWHEQKKKLKARHNLHLICVTEKRLPLKEAMRSYIFNSQLVSLPDGKMFLASPAQCLKSRRSQELLSWITESASNPISEVKYVELEESVKNGGGPACLRLRVVLGQAERQAVAQSANVFLTPALYFSLVNWVQTHYRDRLRFKDLADPELLEESRRALDELSQLLKLGSIYDFQRA